MMIEVLAKRFSIVFHKKRDSSITSISVGGKSISVDVVDFKQSAILQPAAKPHLRFDKVATRLIERLQANLSETVPNGTAILVSITAPIRLASKTTAALEDKIKGFLGGRSLKKRALIHGNSIQIGVMRGVPDRSRKIIVFVHNPKTNPLSLFAMASELVGAISRNADGYAKGAHKRWLVVTRAGEASRLGTYRYIYKQLSIATNFERILMVFNDASVKALN